MKKWFWLAGIIALSSAAIGCAVNTGNNSNAKNDNSPDIDTVAQIVADTMQDRHDIAVSIISANEGYDHNSISRYLSRYTYELATEEKEHFEAIYVVESGEIIDNYSPKDFTLYIKEKAQTLLSGIEEIEVEDIKCDVLYTKNDWKKTSNKEDYVNSEDYSLALEITIQPSNRDDIVMKILEITDCLEEANIHYFAGFKVKDKHFYLNNDAENGRVTKDKIERFYTGD